MGWGMSCFRWKKVSAGVKSSVVDYVMWAVLGWP